HRALVDFQPLRELCTSDPAARLEQLQDGQQPGGWVVQIRTDLIRNRCYGVCVMYGFGDPGAGSPAHEGTPRERAPRQPSRSRGGDSPRGLRRRGTRQAATRRMVTTGGWADRGAPGRFVARTLRPACDR